MLARMVTVRPTRTPLRGVTSACPGCLTLSESIAANFGQGAPAPLTPRAIGCVFATEAALIEAVEQLLSAGIAPHDVHVGAVPQERANDLAQRNGVVADLLADDPFRGMGEYSGEATARRAVDRAGVWGAALGTVAGILLSFTPAGHEIPVPANLQPLANALLFFVLGLFIGSVLGAALAPQQSAHAGFRLIDGMNEGSLALIVSAPSARVDDVARVLEALGGLDLTRI